MRDLVLTGIFIILVPLIFFRPHVGAFAWAWVSLMSPHRLTFGFASALPFGMAVAVTTLVALIFSSQRKSFPNNTITNLLIILVCWMSFTTIFALNPDSNSVIEAWKQVLKIHLMLLVTIMVIRGREHIEQLIWVIVVSIGFYGTKGGVFTILSGGSHRVWGPDGTFIGGNNELALALVALIPLMYYLIVTSKNKWVRIGLWTSMTLCVFSILGSHSRGALVAIFAMAAFFILKSNRPFLLAGIVSATLILAVTAMPAEWFQRMETIGEYQQDGSANSRLHTWETIWNMALDRPIVGAGFKVGSELLYSLYAPYAVTGSTFDSHSIYFQALGEHGFVGLGLFLAIGFTTWRKASKLATATKTAPEQEWVPVLMRMIQVSIVGFASGGAFLGLLHYDFPYYLAGLVVMVEVTIKDNQKQSIND